MLQRITIVGITNICYSDVMRAIFKISFLAFVTYTLKH